MSSGWIAALELLAVLGGLLLLAGRELWVLRRDRAERADESHPAGTKPAAGAGSHAEEH